MISFFGSPLWTPGKLQDLVLLQRGFDITKAEQKPGAIQVFSSSGPNSFHNVSKVEGPGVIIGRKGTLGSVFYSDSSYWPHDTTLWSKDLRGNNAKFVYYALQRIDMTLFDTGAANPTLNRNHVHNLPIFIPERPTQDRIASILSAYDDLIENNRRRIVLLEEAARQLYKEWFVRFRFPGHEHVKIIDGVPEGWSVDAIEEVCQTIGGGTPSTQKREYWDDGEVPWFTPTDVTRNSCLALLNSQTKISDSGLNNSSAKMIPAGSILMTSRASVGFFGINRLAASTNQGFINIVPNDPALRMYLLHNLMWRVEEIRSHAGGATYKEISKGRFRTLPILTPPSGLAGEFEDQATLIHLQVEALHIANQQLAKARDLLLPKLMSGAIAV
ncbi:MAG: restriction endonuclease subunit S [Sphingomonadales bacterium GWF1_63_6]|nr:MAG: restriction endonuclease subunit S [Sphingomonadales bacterium GWF1_63_6]